MPIEQIWQYLTDEEQREKRRRQFNETVQRLATTKITPPTLPQIGGALADASRFYTKNIADPFAEVATQGFQTMQGNPQGILSTGRTMESIRGGTDPLEALRQERAQRNDVERFATGMIFDPINLAGVGLVSKGLRGAAIGINAVQGMAGGAETGQAYGGETGSVVGAIIGGGLGGGIAGKVNRAFGIGGADDGLMMAAKAKGAPKPPPKLTGAALKNAQNVQAKAGLAQRGVVPADLLGLTDNAAMQSPLRARDVVKVAGMESTPLTRDFKAFEHVRDRIIPAQAALAKTQFRKAVAGVFDIAPDGRIRNLGGAPFEDVIRNPSRYGLTDTQMASLDKVGAIIDKIEANSVFYNAADHGMIKITDPKGRYFPRHVIGEDGVASPTRPGPGGKAGLGAKQSFQKERHYEYMEQGMQAGKNYADPANTIELYARAALKHSADAWLINRLDPYSHLGKAKLMESVLHQPATWGKAFTDTAIAEEATRVLSPRAPLSESIGALQSPMILIKATADLSATGTLGTPSLFTNPAGFGRAFIESVKALGGKPISDDILNRHSRFTAALSPEERIRQGVVFADDSLAATDLLPATASQLQGWAAKSQGLAEKASGPFGAAFNRFRTVLAIENFEQSRMMAKMFGQNPDDPKLMRKLAADANRLVGVSSTKPSDLERAALFAPGYFRSQLETIVRAANLTKWDTDTTLLRLRIGTFMTTAMALTAIANELGGQETDWMPAKKVGNEWRWNPNFMRVRNVFGHDVSLLGPWDTLIRMAVAFGTNGSQGDVGGMLEVIRPKLAPGPAIAWDLFSGKDFLGRPTTDSLWSFAKYSGSQMLPFSVGNTVRDRDPMTGATSVLGLKSTPLSPTDLLDQQAGREFGVSSFKSLEPYQQQQMRDRNPELWAKFIANSRDATKQAEAERQRIFKEQQASDARFQAKEISYEDWKKDYARRRDQERAIFGYIYRDQVSAGDTVLHRYFNAIDAAKREDGTTNWDMVDAAVSQMSPEEQAYIERNTKLGGTPLVREYNAMRKQAAPLLKQYADMPAFFGTTVEESKQVTDLVAAARSYQQQFPQGAMPTNVAIAHVGQQQGYAPKIIGIAMNQGELRDPRRSLFWRQHPILEQVYGDLSPLDETA